MGSRTSTDSITIRRPWTADCKGMKADDACSMVHRSRMSTDARGAVVRDEDVLPEGIGADMVGGQGEESCWWSHRRGGSRALQVDVDWAMTELCSPRTC